MAVAHVEYTFTLYLGCIPHMRRPLIFAAASEAGGTSPLHKWANWDSEMARSWPMRELRLDTGGWLPPCPLHHSAELPHGGWLIVRRWNSPHWTCLIICPVWCPFQCHQGTHPMCCRSRCQLQAHRSIPWKSRLTWNLIMGWECLHYIARGQTVVWVLLVYGCPFICPYCQGLPQNLSLSPEPPCPCWSYAWASGLHILGTPTCAVAVTVGCIFLARSFFSGDPATRRAFRLCSVAYKEHINRVFCSKNVFES